MSSTRKSDNSVGDSDADSNTPLIDEKPDDEINTHRENINSTYFSEDAVRTVMRASRSQVLLLH